MRAHLAVQLVERVLHLREHLAAARRQAIDARVGRSFRRRGAQPPAPGHAGEHRVEGARAEAVAVVMQLFEHPLAVHAVLLAGVVQDVDLPEPQQEFTDDRVAHDPASYHRPA